MLVGPLALACRNKQETSAPPRRCLQALTPHVCWLCLSQFKEKVGAVPGLSDTQSPFSLSPVGMDSQRLLQSPRKVRSLALFLCGEVMHPACSHGRVWPGNIIRRRGGRARLINHASPPCARLHLVAAHRRVEKFQKCRSRFSMPQNCRFVGLETCTAKRPPPPLQLLLPAYTPPPPRALSCRASSWTSRLTGCA